MAEEFPKSDTSGDKCCRMNESNNLLMGGSSSCYMGLQNDLFAGGSSTCGTYSSNAIARFNDDTWDQSLLGLQQLIDSDLSSDLLMDSTLQITRFNFLFSSSSSSPDLNQPFNDRMNLCATPAMDFQSDWNPNSLQIFTSRERNSSHEVMNPILSSSGFYTAPSTYDDNISRFFDGDDELSLCPKFCYRLLDPSDSPIQHGFAGSSHEPYLQQLLTAPFREGRKFSPEEIFSKKEREPALKKARMETPTKLLPLKVRKRKLGDQIIALQQLVSPFGKTDTASVLHETLEYIKWLHDNISVLSNPYKSNRIPMRMDLKSQGLCLVPVASAFKATNEISTSLWNPAYGG